LTVSRAAPLLLLVTTLLAACSSGGATFDERGVSFRYPNGWHRVSDIATAGGASTHLFSDNVGLDRFNAAIVAINQVTTPVTAANVSQFAVQFGTAVERLAREEGGTVTQRATSITVNGLPGLQFGISGLRAAGTPVDSTLTLVFKGTNEYFINCQHTAAHAEEITAGCDQIVKTLKIA